MPLCRLRHAAVLLGSRCLVSSKLRVKLTGNCASAAQLPVPSSWKTGGGFGWSLIGGPSGMIGGPRGSRTCCAPVATKVLPLISSTRPHHPSHAEMQFDRRRAGALRDRRRGGVEHADDMDHPAQGHRLLAWRVRIQHHPLARHEQARGHGATGIDGSGHLPGYCTERRRRNGTAGELGLIYLSP